MKKQTTSIAIASIFAMTSIFAAAAVGLNDQELGIGEYGDNASYNSPGLSDQELGIGKYGDNASYDASGLSDQELGIGKYSERA